MQIICQLPTPPKKLAFYFNTGSFLPPLYSKYFIEKHPEAAVYRGRAFQKPAFLASALPRHTHRKLFCK